MCGKPHMKSSIAGRQSLSSPISIPSNIKQLFPCLNLTFQQCPPYDSSSNQPPASYSQWSGRYRPAIIWTGDRGGDGVSIELPLAALRTNPPNGEADAWLTTSIDSPACLPARLPLTYFISSLCLFFILLSFLFSYEYTFMHVKMDGYFFFNISLWKQSLMVINVTPVIGF